MDNIKQRRFIGEAMIQARIITQKQLEEGLHYQKKINKPIGETLVDLGYVKEAALLTFLAGYFYDSGISSKAQNLRILDDIGELASSDFKKWLIFMTTKKASDLHLVAGVSPRLRIYGELVTTRAKPLSPETIKALIYSILTYEEIGFFERNRSLDKSFEVEGISRYRINLNWQKDSIGASIRALPLNIPDFNDLGIPEILKDFCLRPSGLVLVTGPAGSGKSTTLASMIEFINLTRSVHIITIEDPVEYVFKSEKSLIRQRELGRDTLSFAEALKSVVRQDPNVVLLGEMRDLNTIQAALTLAETGHLILSTLHTQDVAHSINRIVDVFPVAYQREVRTKLSLVLQGVIVQQLIPLKNKEGRVLSCEILNCTPSIRNLIRENDLTQIHSYVQMGKKHGMKSMNQSLLDLYGSGIISWEDACLRSNDREELVRLMPKAR